MTIKLHFKRLTLLTFALLGIASLFAQSTISYTNEGVNRTTDGNLNWGFSTSVTTYKGNIYYAYVGSDNKIYAGKKTSNGDNVKVVMGNLQANDFHTKPSITVDKNGYLHVMGDSHNQDWQYYISNNPEDINSWTKQSPPGQRVTYTEYYKDRNDELYILFRMRLGDGGQQDDHVGAMMRYNADNRSFTLLGNSNYDGDGTPVKAVVYGLEGGGFQCYYQQPRQRIFFDANNRMHMVSSVIDPCIENVTSSSGYNYQSHILYAYSDDGGNSFKKANGTAITLPMTTNNASIVVNRSSNLDIVPEHHIGAFDTNTPVVSYLLRDGNGYSKKWNGSSWVNVNVPENTSSFMANDRGVIAWYKQDNSGDARFHISDDGNNWTSLSAAANGTAERNVEAYDLEHFDATGDFRVHFQYYPGGDPRCGIHTFKTGNAVQALGNDQGPSNPAPTGDVFYIKNKETGKYLRPINGNNDAGIQVAAKNDSDWFKWQKVPTSNGYYYLRNVGSGKYFRPQTSTDASLMWVKDTSWDGEWTQWKENPSSDGSTFYFVNRATGKYIRPVNGNTTSNVELRPTSWDGNWTRWTFENVNSGTINVKVRALGVSTQENLKLQINNQTVHTWQLNSSSFKEYTTTISSNGTVRLLYDNDANNRDVRIDWLEIDGNRMQAEAQNVNTGSWNNAESRCGGVKSEWLYCAGYIEFGNVSSDFNVKVRALGVGGDESLKLQINNQTVKTWTVNSSSFKEYTTTVPSGTGNIRLLYDNDDGDIRDVRIDWLEINGVRKQAEDQSVNTGSWNKAENRCGGVKSEWLYCSGYIDFGSNFANTGIAAVAQIPSEEIGFTLFPNPIVGQDMVVKGDVDTFNVQLITLTGRVLTQRRTTQGEAVLDTSLLPTGMYVVRISHEYGTESHKIIVK